MPMNWEIELENGKTWWVASLGIAVRPAPSLAQIVIPVEELEGLTAQEIGEAVLAMVDTAWECYASELAYYVLDSPSYTEQIKNESDSIALLQRYSRNERVKKALDIIYHGHPPIEKEKVVPKRKQSGYIYLLQSADGSYKIGKTKSVPNRVNTLAIQLPHPIEVIHTIQVTDMVYSETFLHTKFAHCRLNGEWFALLPEDIDYICSLTALEEL